MTSCELLVPFCCEILLLCALLLNVPKPCKSLQQSYAAARKMRTLHGHHVAAPYYRDILEQNPDDRTAGSRLAASNNTPVRHDEACGGKFCSREGNWRIDLLDKRENIQELGRLLRTHNYDYQHVAQFFGVKQQIVDNSKDTLVVPCCMAPLFVSPVAPGSVSLSNYPLSAAKGPISGLSCLIALFLLSLAVPTKWVVEMLGNEYVDLMQEFGWLYPCSVDPDLMVPYVHVCPLDFGSSCLRLVTDLHPRVLSTTSLGSGADGTGNAVMYIGPDSLALVQHFLPYFKRGDKQSAKMPFCGLDLCTGSGIQALSTLMMHQQIAKTNSSPKMTAIDVNPRALRFTLFNAILNGFEDDLSLIHADLRTGRLMEDFINTQNLEEYLEQHKYSLILGNPPFVPTPVVAENLQNNNNENQREGRDTVKSISQRYGLFSSGGADGESILRRIVEIARCNLEMGGFLGVVSEFFTQTNDPHFQRFAKWWSEAEGSSIRCTDASSPGTGVLFLNEFPIDSETYSTRRSETPQERDVWLNHLNNLNVSTASPGLMYIQKDEIVDPGPTSKSPTLSLTISRVPRTQTGSVWTPSNIDAIQWTHNFSLQLFDTVKC